MGLLDKVKNTLSGDWADVSVQVAGPLVRGGALNATVNVQVKNSPIKVESVVFEVRCEEHVHIQRATITGAGTTVTGSASAVEALVDHEVPVSGPQELAAGSTSTFTTSVPITSEAPPTMAGRNARYEWKVRARVDMKGNDPDSGWQTIHVA
jgi:hypothetical protein